MNDTPKFIDNPRLQEIERLRVNAAPAVRRSLDEYAERIRRDLLKPVEEERERRAQEEREINEEEARLASNPPFRWRRFLVRSLRVTFALPIGALAWWLFQSAPDIGNTPLAALTLGSIGANFWHVVFGFAASVCALAIAFGDGPDADPVPPSALRERAISNLQSRKAWRFEDAPTNSTGEVPMDERRPYSKFVNLLSRILFLVLVALFVLGGFGAIFLFTPDRQ